MELQICVQQIELSGDYQFVFWDLTQVEVLV